MIHILENIIKLKIQEVIDLVVVIKESIDIIDATVTTTAGATANFEGDENTTDVSITKISRTEYMNLTKKQEESSGDARPTQFCLINGQVTTNGSSNSGRPEYPMTLFLYPNPDKAYIFKYFFLVISH